ncbi:uncharacterized protein LOC113561267 [Rhopalosiphum maidis]|uniref:uncharacterized protein LOC113561267 n=1 Tax=Rhopalosiphum maidis TaxID=43146 RepID=UPI000EFF15C3|nr:uncharacterized protein LOC113561267 [Rhopalosiphum maidis]
MNASRSVAGSLASVLGFALMLIAVAVAESVPVAHDNVAALQTTKTAVPAEGRGHFKKMMLNPYMLIPQLIALGFTPIVLANLKMMVMSALMINNMALNAAIFMTIRNMVFGPRPKVKYVNHGYHEHQHHHNHRQEDGDRQHYHNERQSEQQPPSLKRHTPSEGTQKGTDQRRKRTDTAIAASLRRPAPPPPLLRHRV